MKSPWQPDRWRAYCLDKIATHWDTKLEQDAEPGPSLTFLDIFSVSGAKPAKIWSMAGLEEAKVNKACVVNWMLLRVHRTREFIHKMKIINSNLCSACPMNVIGSIEHFYSIVNSPVKSMKISRQIYSKHLENYQFARQ